MRKCYALRFILLQVNSLQKKEKSFPTDRNNPADKNNLCIRWVVSIRWAIVFKPVWLRRARVVIYEAISQRRKI